MNFQLSLLCKRCHAPLRLFRNLSSDFLIPSKGFIQKLANEQKVKSAKKMKKIYIFSFNGPFYLYIYIYTYLFSQKLPFQSETRLN